MTRRRKRKNPGLPAPVRAVGGAALGVVAAAVTGFTVGFGASDERQLIPVLPVVGVLGGAAMSLVSTSIGAGFAAAMVTAAFAVKNIADRKVRDAEWEIEKKKREKEATTK